jgi:hypothetical protein
MIRKIKFLLITLLMIIFTTTVFAGQDTTDTCMLANDCYSLDSFEKEVCAIQNSCALTCLPGDLCYDFIACIGGNMCDGNPSDYNATLECVTTWNCTIETPPCYNGVQDGAEEGIDCGGLCSVCEFEGNGTSENPYVLETCNDLYANIKELDLCLNDSYFALNNSIDCSANTGVSNGCATFNGFLEGNNYTIQIPAFIEGLTTGGIFRAMTTGGFSNLKVKDGNLISYDAGQGLGGIAGDCVYVLFDNVVVENFTIDQNNYSSYSGGLCGKQSGIDSIIVTNSYVKNLTFTNTVDNKTGGFRGSGHVTSNNSYVSVTGSNFGISPLGTVGNTYWDLTIGATTDGSGATGLTTTEMQTHTNFVGFDFDDTWGINDNDGLPCLLWEDDCSAYVEEIVQSGSSGGSVAWPELETKIVLTPPAEKRSTLFSIGGFNVKMPEFIQKFIEALKKGWNSEAN